VWFAGDTRRRTGRPGRVKKVGPALARGRGRSRSVSGCTEGGMAGVKRGRKRGGARKRKKGIIRLGMEEGKNLRCKVQGKRRQSNPALM